MRKLPIFIALLSVVSSCKMGSRSISFTTSPAPTPCEGGPYSILVSWTANREKAVNAAGGGYRVYYSNASPVSTSTAPYVNVPYVSGATAPTSKSVTGLTCGTWRFRVVAYSPLHPSGSSSGSRSADSSEVSVTVP